MARKPISFPLRGARLALLVVGAAMFLPGSDMLVVMLRRRQPIGES